MASRHAAAVSPLEQEADVTALTDGRRDVPAVRGSQALAVPDDELVARALDGGDAGFLPLYQAYYRYVRWAVGRILTDPSEAEDCCQEVWMKVRRNLASYQGRGLRAWLGVVASNHARDALRAHEKQRRALTAALEVYRYERLRAEAEAAPLAADHGALLHALDGLEDLQRRVVDQRLSDPKASLEAIGAALEQPRHKIKYAWKTALETLKVRLGEWATAQGALALLVAAARRLHG